MGIFDFVKNAGEKIFKPSESRREDAIEKHLASYGIGGIKVEVDGARATLTGTAKDIATREKAVLVAGNIEGIEQVDDRIQVTHSATAAAPSPVQSGTATTPTAAAPAAGTASVDWTSRTYTVKSGDTLSRIAKEMYGDAGKYPQIFEANKPMLADPDKIYPGQVLRIPQEA